MLRNKTYQRLAAVIFTAVYLFVALFSQNFHNHGSGEVFKDFNFKKSEKTYSPGHLSQEFTDCLSCHLLHDGHSLFPEDFQFKFVQPDDFQKEIFAYAQRFSKLEFFSFQLRGPPSNFI
ncbi:hypothetical protein OK344_03635 [Kaistella sp. BT6-1-3]|uniref:Cytochrome c domain-containing protein n=1 Tax=Kaistella yananensis TaxID=2989820 RepID=A0ABT3JKI4_9FLAO|nr:hypothetical protein [Kaistella yananensis]MCW4451293.1 hypothetical protein [Kaistella yananensis]